MKSKQSLRATVSEGWRLSMDPWFALRSTNGNGQPHSLEVHLASYCRLRGIFVMALSPDPALGNSENLELFFAETVALCVASCETSSRPLSFPLDFTRLSFFHFHHSRPHPTFLQQPPIFASKWSSTKQIQELFK